MKYCKGTCLANFIVSSIMSYLLKSETVNINQSMVTFIEPSCEAVQFFYEHGKVYYLLHYFLPILVICTVQHSISIKLTHRLFIFY